MRKAEIRRLKPLWKNYLLRTPGRPARSASRPPFEVGFARAAIRRAASAFWSSTTARAWRTCRSSPTPSLPNYETEIKQLSRRLQRDGRRRSESLGRQGAGDRSARRRSHRPRLGRSRSVSAAEEAALVREAARVGPPAAADEYVRRGRPRAQSHLPIDSRLLSGRGLPLHPHADHHGQRLRRGRRDVPRHDARPGEAAAQRRRRVDYAQDFFERPAYLTVCGQLEGEIFATALGKIYTFGPTFRAENSNTSRHLAEFWMVEPEAGVLRARPTTWSWPSGS